MLYICFRSYTGRRVLPQGGCVVLCSVVLACSGGLLVSFVWGNFVIFSYGFGVPGV